MTDHPYILAFASPEAPLDVRWLPGNGAVPHHLIVASRVLGLLGDSVYRMPVSVFTHGDGLVLDGREFPGTFTLVMVMVSEAGDVTVDTGAGVPPSAAFLWVASTRFDVRARGLLGRQYAEQDQRAAGSALTVGRGGQSLA